MNNNDNPWYAILVVLMLCITLITVTWLVMR